MEVGGGQKMKAISLRQIRSSSGEKEKDLTQKPRTNKTDGTNHYGVSPPQKTNHHYDMNNIQQKKIFRRSPKGTFSSNRTIQHTVTNPRQQ
jgi:hypothetical protein